MGNHLIYDTDQDITWYDYTRLRNNWYNQMSWADNLTVTMPNGRIFTDWGLPTTPGTPLSLAVYIGVTGVYTNEGEMGHLYYDELGNVANVGWVNMNRGPFTNLVVLDPELMRPITDYWSGSEYAAEPRRAWYFDFGRYGIEGTCQKYVFDVLYSYDLPAMVVHFR